MAVVTGANGGIGKAVAERLWNDGYCLVLFYRENRCQLDAFIADRGGPSDDDGDGDGKIVYPEDVADIVGFLG